MPSRSKKTPPSTKIAFRFKTRLLKTLVQFKSNIKHLDSKSKKRHIHQLRVQSRRLRALFSITKLEPAFSSLEPTAKGVKKLTGLLSPIRSLDVSDALFQTKIKSLPADSQEALKFCHQALRTWRRDARRKLEKSAKKLLHHSLKKGPPFPAGGMDPVLLLQTLQQGRSTAAERAGAAFEDYRKRPSIAKLHHLRIQLKKFRYILEIESDLTKEAQPSLASLKTLQDHIGSLHDLQVLKAYLEKPEIAVHAKHRGVEKEWREFLHRLKSELHAGERDFLPQYGEKLEKLLAREIP